MRSGRTMSALSSRSTRSSIPATIGRVSFATNIAPSPRHCPTRIPWSGASWRTSARNAASTATASSSPRVSFIRVKPHMSTNAKHRNTRTPTVWRTEPPIAPRNRRTAQPNASRVSGSQRQPRSAQLSPFPALVRFAHGPHYSTCGEPSLRRMRANGASRVPRLAESEPLCRYVRRERSVSAAVSTL